MWAPLGEGKKVILKKTPQKMALCLILNNFLLQIISFFDQTSSCVSVLVPFVLRWYLSSLWRKIRVSFSRIVHLSLRAACNEKIYIKTLFLKKNQIKKVWEKSSMLFLTIQRKHYLRFRLNTVITYNFILSQVKFSSQTLGKRHIPKKASERRKI